MFDRILKRMRELIRTRHYVMTVHAEDEMSADGLGIYDLESVVLSGQIRERQKDRTSLEWKYLIKGKSLAGQSITVVVKIGPTDKLVFITVYRE
jgi:hypothetical protein